MRVLLRFLITEEKLPPGLLGAVPTVRKYRQASIPRYLPRDEVDHALQLCPRETPIGIRDAAILILLARLGLRAGEVARLHLEDIDWVDGSILVRAGKTARERGLPLSQEVAHSVLQYLKVGRPKSGHRTVFLACRAPFGPLNPFTICSIARYWLQQAGASHLGAHALRHTAATQMIRCGATFKEVADVLGHQHLGTTRIYAKLDLGTLSRVALPWPEEAYDERH